MQIVTNIHLQNNYGIIMLMWGWILSSTWDFIGSISRSLVSVIGKTQIVAKTTFGDAVRAALGQRELALAA